MGTNIQRNNHEEIYKNHLTNVAGIRFTSRECDIMSCIVNTRGEKKIASICSISPKTVSVHIYNIMNKLQCNSREQIVDFIEMSGKIRLFREYYSHLLARHYFNVSLIKISKLIPKNSILYIDARALLENPQLDHAITKDLAQAGIKVLKDHKNIEETIDVSKMKKEKYYEDLLLLLDDIYRSSKLSAIISEFKTNLLSTEELSIGPIIALSDDSKRQIFTHKKHYTILAAIIIAIATAIYTSTSDKYILDQTSIENAIKDLESFVEISKTNNFTANNMDKETLSKNQSLIKKVESLSNCRNMKSTQEYLAKAEMSPEFILSYMHGLQALASYYMYHQHDGSKAEEVLLHAKYIAENYVSKLNKVRVDFDKLAPEEILSEMQIIKHLPQMYTRVIYSLGRTSIYTKKFDDGKKYFKISKYLGKKLGIFEGHLSDTAGLLAIEIKKDVDVTKAEEEVIRLRKLIASFEEVRRDDNQYILDYNPNLQVQQIVIPTESRYSITYYYNNILKIYSHLILVDKEENILKEDLKLANISIEADQASKSGASRQRAYFYNSLATCVLSLFDRGYRKTFTSKTAAKIANSEYIDDLDVALKLYELAKAASREADYTKADAYDGAIKVLERKMQTYSPEETEKEEIIEKIREYEEHRNLLNKALFRNG
ncbi:MAG: hypothetical protein KA998_02465 [Rickettsiaceae bacterium]|nr:hypothetical protein [Rickettsiaceae bacterium]